MTSTENIVFRYDPQQSPAVGYRALPSGCTGAAATLDEARSSYRAQLCARLGVDRHGLPPVVEYVEARVNGMWVREQIGTVHRDLGADRMLLQTILAPGAVQAEFRGVVERASEQAGEQAGESGVEPVVLLVDPDQPVGAVLDQMGARDTVVVVFADAARALGWTVIHGPHARGAGAASWLPDGAQIRDLPVHRFAINHPCGRVPRLHDAVLEQAS
ncbi:hypothetical protein [Mycolicibacterium palauense]|uniref:hypothetical protein n=1 Tax=Mycolicibacterium palauense TaxID=2034511 RepID=UPI000BFEAC79|nr:hypothetical protein [Mycolicibacterium palauense]